MVTEGDFGLALFVKPKLGKLSLDCQSKLGFWNWLTPWNTPLIVATFQCLPMWVECMPVGWGVPCSICTAPFAPEVASSGADGFN